MAINLNEFKKSTTTPATKPAPKPATSTKVDLAKFKKGEEKKESLFSKVSAGIRDFADVSSANLFSGVASTAGAVEQLTGKGLSLVSKASGRIGEGIYKGVGLGVGLFSEKGKDTMFKIGDDFKKLNYDFAELEEQAGRDINAFLSEGGRESKEIILKNNEGYQSKKAKETKINQDAYQKAIKEGKTPEEAEEIAKDALQDFKFKDLTSKDFLLYDLYGSLVENAPTMIATIYTGGVAGGATKAGTVVNFLSKVGGSTAFGTGVNAMREAESAYSSALEQGFSKEEAIERSERVFERNAGANLGLEALQMAFLFAPQLRSASPFIKALAETGRFAGAGVIETGQERMEDSIQEQAGNEKLSFEQMYDQLVDRKITKTDAISFILGMGFQGLGNVMIDRNQLDRAVEQQIELIADKLPDDGKGGTDEERVERAIENNPDAVEQIVRQTQETVRNTSSAVQNKAEGEQLRGDVEQMLASGMTPTATAVELAKKIGSVEAKALVDEVSRATDRFVSRETVPDSTIAPQSRGIETTEATVNELNNILDKTPADLQEDFNADQKGFESTLTDLRNKVTDIKTRLDNAEDRSALKKKLKVELAKAKEAVATAEGDFNTKLTEKTQQVRDYLSDFIKNTPNVNLTSEQQAQLVENVVDRITNPSIQGALTSVRAILRAEYVRVKNPRQKPAQEAEGAQETKVDGKTAPETAEALAKEGKTRREVADTLVETFKMTRKEAVRIAEGATKETTKEKKTQKETVKEVVAKKEKASIKEIAEETGILEPNVRRILGVGTKEGEFERVADGVYRITANGQEIAVIVPADAVTTLPALAKDGFKADMVFLDIPYDTPAVKGGNRGVNYKLLSVNDFSKLLDSVKVILRDDTAPVIHMFSQAPSGMKAMQKYNDLFPEKGFIPVGRGEYQKTFADGSPVTSPNGKVAQPEGILVFTQSGELKKDIKNLNFKMVRPKGYQTEKPAEMMKAMIEMTTDEGDVILDPFAGSGVTGAEAVRTGRKAVLIEKDKEVAEKITKPRVEKAVKEKESEEETTNTKQRTVEKSEIENLMAGFEVKTYYYKDGFFTAQVGVVREKFDPVYVSKDGTLTAGIDYSDTKAMENYLYASEEEAVKALNGIDAEREVFTSTNKPKEDTDEDAEAETEALTGEKLLTMTKPQIRPLLVDGVNIPDKGGKALAKVSNKNAGATFSEISAPKMLGLREDGVFTDSFILINDKKIAEELYEKMFKKYPALKDAKDVGKPEWTKVVPETRDKVEIQGYLISGFTPTVILNTGEYQLAVDPDKLALAKSYFPDATVHATGVNRPLVFEQNGKIKALVMPVNGVPRGNNFPLEPLEAIKPAKAKVKEPKKDGEKIEDIGEKIGGARKDLFAKQAEKYLATLDDKEVAVMKLSEVLPPIDYENLLANGVSEDALAVYTYWRAEIQRKPTGRSYKLRRWVDAVQALRLVGKTMFEGGQKMNDVVARSLNMTPQLRESVRLYKDLDFVKNPAVRNLSLQTGTTTDGEAIFILRKNGHDINSGFGGRWATNYAEILEKAKNAIKETEKTPAGEVDQTKFISVFRRGTQYLTAYKKGQRFVEFELFASREEALEAYRDPEKLAEYIKGMEEAVNFDQNSFRKQENEAPLREYRKGDITAQDFMDTFGFRGVEFGNWVNQKERQDRLNFAFDALKDLSTTLDIPDKSISLNGELGFAFGSRGRKGASAHYEPEKVVINLTKENGSGTIAHEWWHALDNYLARRNGDKRQYLTDTLRYERPEVREAFYDLMKSIQKSPLYERSKQADRVKGKRYFTNRTELGARAFEVYVKEKLASQGMKNDYLVNLIRTEDLDVTLEKINPYAIGEEIAMVTEKMDAIFDQLQTEANPSSALFSLKKRDVLNLTVEQGEIQAEMLGVAMDMGKGLTTEAEGKAKLTELWQKIEPTLSDEQRAVLNTENHFSLKRAGKGGSTQEQNRFTFLEEVKKRWKIDFDVYFVDTILAGTKTDKMKQKSVIEAWGAYSDNTIALVRDALQNTDRHEVVHLTLDNAYRIPIMQKNGITKDAVLRAQAEEMGIDFDKATASQRTEIEEQVAVNFENYRNDKYQPKGLLEKFFALLKKLIAQMSGAIEKDSNIVKDYYELLDEGVDVDAQMAFFENQGMLQSFITDGVLDLRGSALAVNFDEAPASRKLAVKSARLKMKEGEDKYLQKVKKMHNDVASKLDQITENTEKWRGELDTTIQKKAETAEVIGETPENVKKLARFTTKTPPKGVLTPRGKAVAGELEFANPEEAEAEVRAYLERKTELVETRNRLRTIRRDIAKAVKEGKANRNALRDIERRLKARKEYLERKDLHKKIGRNEQMRMIARRGRLLRETQDFLRLSDEKARDLIGGIGRQRIHTMTEKEFDNFMVEFVNRGTDIMNTLDARDSVKALIQEMQFQNEDNVRRALKLPTIPKMSKEQAETFYKVLEQYEFGDKFLTTRQLETIHRTAWAGAMTEREMHAKILETTGISREDLANVEVQQDVQKFKNWLVLSRSNPMFAWLVDKRIKAKIEQKAELVAFEKELNPLVNKARKSRTKDWKEGVANAFAPSDEIVFDYIENENKEAFAKEKGMTQEELDLAHFLMGRLFEPARQYMTSEYGMKDRENYITHVRRDIVETFFDAVRQGRGAGAGVKDAIREIFTAQQETEQQFKILAGKTGEVLAFEKFFQFAMPRTGNLVPTKNVARASLAYANAYFNKKALDKLIPEAVALVKVQEQIKGYTEKGLPKDPTVKTFVDQFLNDAKGRKIEFITQQGSTLDSALRLGVAWTAFKYLGFRPLMGMVNFIGEFVGVMRATTTVEKWRGLSRTLNYRKARRINQAHEYFTGRNPLVEILDPQHGIASKIKDTALVLYSLATFFNNRFYLRAKMTEAEWQEELMKDDRMVEIAKEMSKWRNTDFYIKSLAGGTATGSVFSQFATWAIPIVTTTLSDTQQTYKNMRKDGFKKGITSEEARSLGTTLALMGTLVVIANTIKQMAEVDDEERDIWFYITREMNTLLGAFQTVWDLEGRAPILRDLLNLQKLIIQTLTAEKYEQDGEGYGVGDWKAGVTFGKLVTPTFITDTKKLIVGEPERENTKERLIQEAIDAGTEPDAEAMLELISPDEWNNVKGERTEEEQLAYQTKKKGEIMALYNLRKTYPDSKVAEIVSNPKLDNKDKVEQIKVYMQEAGVDTVYDEVKDIHQDRNLCADPKKKTGCIISGTLFKDVQRAKKDLPK